MLEKQTLFLLAAILIAYFAAFGVFQASASKKRALKTKCWVINLKKNKDRIERFTYFYEKSDISSLPLHRFDAINGREIDAKRYVTKVAYETLLLNEKNRYRTKHYQLTRGAIGCYLSHVSIFKKLLEDPDCDYYVIFEDDAAILPKVEHKLQVALRYAPDDWDIILLAPIMEVILERTPMFKKYESFWGLCGYVINKRGARKFVEEFDAKPIAMQIDSKMSLMIMEDKLTVYGYNEKLIWHDRSMGTDIQMPLKRVANVNPFLIEEL